MRLLLLTGLVAAVLLAGCGGGDGPPSKLSRDDARKLAQARERLDDAIDTEETLRTSRAEARRILHRIDLIADSGVLEGPADDKFTRRGLARVSELAPSLVLVDARGRPRKLDTPAAIAFRDRAARDPAGALLRPARREVATIDQVLDDADAGPKTRVAGPKGPTAERFLRSTEADVRPIWPALARRLAAARADL